MDNYLQQVVVPFYTPLMATTNCFAVHDLSARYVIASDNWAQLLGFSHGNELTNYTDSELGKFGSSLIAASRLSDQTVLNDEQALEEFYALKPYDTVIAVQKIPVFNPHAQVVAIKTILQCFRFIYPFMVIKGLLTKPFFHSEFIINNQQLAKFSEQEAMVIFMLTMRYTRSEIAAWLGIHLSRLNRILNSLAEKLGLKHGLQEQIMGAIITQGLHRYIPTPMLRLIINHANTVLLSQRSGPFSTPATLAAVANLNNKINGDTALLASDLELTIGPQIKR